MVLPIFATKTPLTIRKKMAKNKYKIQIVANGINSITNNSNNAPMANAAPKAHPACNGLPDFVL